LPGVPLHVVQRGNNRSACFFGDEDRSFYLHHLSRLASLSACDVHAYCLMTNHVHLLLTPRTAQAVAQLMRRLDLLYSQYVNRKYGRTGSLWEGRFRSCVVESEAYLLHCYRYIELNPVRANLVRHAAQYRWSSYGCNALGAEPGLLMPHAEYLRLGADMSERTRNYLALFEYSADVTSQIREATNGNFALGTKAFVERLASSLGRRVQRRRPGRPVRQRLLQESEGLIENDENVVRP